jgi:hypothetical protein
MISAFQQNAFQDNAFQIGAAAPAKKGGWSAKEKKLNDKLRRLALQQARFNDEEEVIALILSMMKNN